jgi:cell division inhibitor SepF
MAFFKKAMNYLGLGPDDAYDEYDVPVEAAPGRAPRSSYGADPIDSGTVRTVPAGAGPARAQGSRAPGPVDTEQPTVTVKARAGSAVRTMPAGSAPPRPYTVRPTRFDHAQEVADNFREGVPVIVNLQDVNKDLLRRIIDFCAGLTYGLDGSMDKVGTGMYLLTPANVSVSPEDRRRMSDPEHDA